jgi:hypothetical protein
MSSQLPTRSLILAVSLLGVIYGDSVAAPLPQSQFLGSSPLSPTEDGTAVAQGLDPEARYLRTVRSAGLELCRGLQADHAAGPVRGRAPVGHTGLRGGGFAVSAPTLAGAPALANVPAQPRIFGTF